MWALFKLLGVFTAFGLPAGLVGIPYTLAVRDVSAMYGWAMWTIRTGLRAAGVRVELAGRERVPAGKSCIFLSNHLSNLDPPVLLPVLPGRCSVLLKRELMRIPVLGTAMRLANFVPVDRGSRPEAAAASVAAAGDALRAGLHILVFPEGTRSLDGRLQRFKKGPFYLAMETGAPLVPVVVTGTERMMSKGSVRIVPGVARVEMLPAIYPKDFGTREELMAAVRAAMVAALPEEMRPLDVAAETSPTPP